MLAVFTPDRLRRLTLGLLGAAVWVSSAPLAAAPRIAITVRVYQTAGLSSAIEEKALAETETLLQSAQVNVRWRKCSGPANERYATCDALPGPSELTLRILGEKPHKEATPGALGDAVVIRCAGGVLATVYYDQVEWRANEAGTETAVLLGRVAAHELGHLLMRSASHTIQGLMRPNWTPTEIRLNRVVDWRFTGRDIDAMRQPGVADSLPASAAGSPLPASSFPRTASSHQP